MRKLLVFQHVATEPLGTLDGQFKAAGFRVRYMNFSRLAEARPDVGRYHGLVVLGGPMGADQSDRYPHLEVEKDAIRQAVDAGIPVLGICLGAQLIASALGARIRRNPVTEIGWFDVSPTAAGREDALFSKFDGAEKIFQWHGDTFTLPDGACHLAESEACANQAFRIGESVYGLQFHLEADRALIERWLRSSSYLRELAECSPAVDSERILADTSRFIDRATALSEALFGEFIERFYSRRRRVALPSR
ncbi:MAG: amidotransferase [Gammaproteobacteria bacterium]|nr:MAG: amidotransferase [Gammaproteobacteria bacterium]